MSKLPKGWSYILVGDQMYIVDEKNDTLYLVTGNYLEEVRYNGPPPKDLKVEDVEK